MEHKKSTWISRHQLLSFFILSYAISSIIALISKYVIAVPTYSFFGGVMIFSPTISAFIVAGLAGGLEGIKKLLSGFTRWKINFKWYLAAFSLTLIPLLVALVYIALGNTIPGMKEGTTVPFLLQQLLLTLVFGPLAEETGWRGFALPRLQKKFNALLSSLILGVIWAFWHLPFYFISGGAAGIPFPIYVVLVMTLTIFLTWIYNNSKGNLVLCILMHFFFNFNSAFIVGWLGLMPPMLFYIVCGAGLGVYVLAVIFIFGYKHLSKSADRNQHVTETTI